MSKFRLDAAIVARGLTSSRAQAQQLISTGSIEVCTAGLWLRADKPAQKVSDNQDIRITDSHYLKYVSRAGLKLEKIIDYLPLNLKGVTALDIGQSTGGFTDCLLQHGAAKVVGVDVGHNQLAPELRSNPAVVCLEKINARFLPHDLLFEHAPEGFDIGVMDVSFISQTLIIQGLAKIMKPRSAFVSLVKPQFEVGREHIAKGGIVKNERLYVDVEKKIRLAFAEIGFKTTVYVESPITGGDGNREFLTVATRT